MSPPGPGSPMWAAYRVRPSSDSRMPWYWTASCWKIVFGLRGSEMSTAAKPAAVPEV